MAAAPGADEARAAHYLRARGLGYTPGPHMTGSPITPTRIIPASALLPPRAPEPGEEPPWRTPPAPPMPPAPVPGPPPEVVHRHTVEVILVPPVAEPDPTWWDRALGAVRRIGQPWQVALALAGAVAPVLPGRYSAGTTWAYCVHQIRADHGAAWAYGVAVGVLLLAAGAVYHRPGLIRIWIGAVALIGISGAMSWWDPIAALTGVHR